MQTDLKLTCHIGGKTALSLVYGKTQYASDRKTELFCYKQEKLPTWFKVLYKDSYTQFMTNFLPPDECVVEWENAGYKSLVSTQERALLEMLYQIPSSVTPQEGFEITQLITAIKPVTMHRNKC